MYSIKLKLIIAVVIVQAFCSQIGEAINFAIIQGRGALERSGVHISFFDSSIGIRITSALSKISCVMNDVNYPINEYPHFAVKGHHHKGDGLFRELAFIQIRIIILQQLHKVNFSVDLFNFSAKLT